MITKNYKKGHIVEYAKQVGTIVSISEGKECSIILFDGNEVQTNIANIKGILLSKQILKTIGFTQFSKCYTSDFLKDTEKSKLGYDYPTVSLEYYDMNVIVSVFIRKLKGPKCTEVIHINNLHELQDAYKDKGYTIPISSDMLVNIQECIMCHSI